MKQGGVGIVAGATEANDALSGPKEGLECKFGLGDLVLHLFGGKGGETVGMVLGVVGDLVSFFGELVEDVAMCGDMGIFADQKEGSTDADFSKQLEDAGHGVGVDRVGLVGRWGGKSVDIVVKAQRIDIHTHRTKGLGGHTPPPYSKRERAQNMMPLLPRTDRAKHHIRTKSKGRCFARRGCGSAKSACRQGWMDGGGVRGLLFLREASV